MSGDLALFVQAARRWALGVAALGEFSPRVTFPEESDARPTGPVSVIKLGPAVEYRRHPLQGFSLGMSLGWGILAVDELNHLCSAGFWVGHRFPSADLGAWTIQARATSGFGANDGFLRMNSTLGLTVGGTLGFPRSPRQRARHSNPLRPLATSDA